MRQGFNLYKSMPKGALAETSAQKGKTWRAANNSANVCSFVSFSGPPSPLSFFLCLR
jgi:hypothetical protein